MSRGNGTIELATQLLEKYLGKKRASKGLSDMLAASLISEQACPLHNDGGKTYYAEKIATGTCQPRSPSDIYIKTGYLSPIVQGYIMQTYVSKNFTATNAWGATDIANFDGTTVRLHWTDKPYKWHINDGQEVFAVMDGRVDMYYKEAGETKIFRLNTGDVFYAATGTEHVAHPVGEARILVIEKEGSV